MVSNRTRANNSLTNKVVNTGSRVSQIEKRAPARVATDAVDAGAIAPEAVGTEAIKPEAITTEKIRPGAVGTRQLGALDSITASTDFIFRLPEDKNVYIDTGNGVLIPVGGGTTAAEEIITGTLDPARLSNDVWRQRTATNGTVDPATDWNTLTSPGTYRIDKSTSTDTTINAPNASYDFGMLVVGQSGDTIVQTYYTDSTGGETYFRQRYDNTTWKTWRAFVQSATGGVDAAQITSGTILNARLPSRISDIGPEISNTDLFTFRGSGWYRGINITNAPDSGWWYIHYTTHNADWVNYVAYDYFSQDVRRARLEGGVFSGWKSLVQGTGDATERDKVWPVPSTAADRLALHNMGARWYRTDRGWTEQYYTTTADGAVAGKGAVTASGWYPISGALPAVEVGAVNAAYNYVTGASHRIAFDAMTQHTAPDAITYEVGTGVASSAVTVLLTGRYDIGLSLGWTHTSSTWIDYTVRHYRASVLVADAANAATGHANPSVAWESVSFGRKEYLVTAGDWVQPWLNTGAGNMTIQNRGGMSKFSVHYVKPPFVNV